MNKNHQHTNTFCQLSDLGHEHYLVAMMKCLSHTFFIPYIYKGGALLQYDLSKVTLIATGGTRLWQCAGQLPTYLLAQKE